MGRKKKMLTDEEREERKKRWWGEEHNARRRARYASDPEYRARAIENTRRKYKDRGPSADVIHLTEARQKLASFGKVREVKFPDGSVRQMMVLTGEELGQVLNRSVNMIYRWRSGGKLPYGALTCHIDRSEVQVYSVPEVAAIVDVLKEHFEERMYYHDKHVETIQKLNDRVNETRRSLGIHDGSTSTATDTAA